jgi:hypothetical protein
MDKKIVPRTHKINKILYADTGGVYNSLGDILHDSYDWQEVGEWKSTDHREGLTVGKYYLEDDIFIKIGLGIISVNAIGDFVDISKVVEDYADDALKDIEKAMSSIAITHAAMTYDPMGDVTVIRDGTHG